MSEEKDKKDLTEQNKYEDVCYICHRPESVAGKMIHIPNDITICNDCMQKTFDSMANFGFGGPFSTTFNGDPQKNQDNQAKDNKESGDEDDKKKQNINNIDLSGIPNISMLNLSDLFPKQPKVKKRKSDKDSASRIKPVFSIDNIPHPHEINNKLDEYVVGQEQAKKVMSVAVYNHYKRVATNTMDEIEIEKSNILMIGPTGSGKTYMVRTLARLLDVPLAIADATSLTEAGYIGDDIESVISKLLVAADNDVEKAEKGIVFIDEIDKIARKNNANQRDVNGESVQQGLLKLLEGADVEVPVGATSKNAMVPMVTINTRNILFICGGAFPGLEDIIKERLSRHSLMGFCSDLKDQYDRDPDILSHVTTDDIRAYGMIPEFIGRLPVICTLRNPDRDMMVRILREPKNAILKQYQKLLGLDGVKLTFDEDALYDIADEALEKKTGARALRSIIEEFMLDIMYEIPKDKNIGGVEITRDYIEKHGGPVITVKGQELPEESPAT